MGKVTCLADAVAVSQTIFFFFRSRFPCVYVNVKTLQLFPTSFGALHGHPVTRSASITAALCSGIMLGATPP